MVLKFKQYLFYYHKFEIVFNHVIYMEKCIVFDVLEMGIQ
ncbi:hypothetical protein EV128_111193 [Rhizobium azibense]|nr:hypothetical protein EV128_111193 [Rhizobium azibense]